MPKTKCFVLDTNVLLHNSQSINSFTDNTVVLPMAVIEELDKFKSHTDELGRNARQVIRELDGLRSQGQLRDGVPNKQGGIVKILSAKQMKADSGLEQDQADNRILQVAYGLQKAGETVIFVSKDINARLKADAIGVEAQDFEKQKINIDELYTGYKTVEVTKAVIDSFYSQKQCKIPELELFPNEFVVLAEVGNPKHTALAKSADGKVLVPLCEKFASAWNIKSRSFEQRIAFEILLDTRIPLVTLVGQAGTGKTLLALAAAMELTLHQKAYDKILVSRPVMPLGHDIGFLPGSKDDKLQFWMQPIFDNLSFLLRSEPTEGLEKTEKKVSKLFEQHSIEVEALTYIRGRTISRHFMIVDEAQNLTPHEIKTIVSRAGEGTKVVLTGDPYQIDNPYLDSNSNGLTYAAERLKTEATHGHVTLRKSERSSLAAIAAELL